MSEKIVQPKVFSAYPDTYDDLIFQSAELAEKVTTTSGTLQALNSGTIYAGLYALNCKHTTSAGVVDATGDLLLPIVDVYGEYIATTTLITGSLLSPTTYAVIAKYEYSNATQQQSLTIYGDGISCENVACLIKFN